MGRPPNLPAPLAAMAEEAGSVERLRKFMGDVPASTLSRWKRLIEAGRPIPRSATNAIKQAQQTLAKRRRKATPHVEE